MTYQIGIKQKSDQTFYIGMATVIPINSVKDQISWNLISIKDGTTAIAGITTDKCHSISDCVRKIRHVVNGEM
jgi:hypothetical protein